MCSPRRGAPRRISVGVEENRAAARAWRRRPAAGRLRQARAAARFSRTPPEIRRGAPRLGEHTQEVLAELGYSAEEIAGLRSDSIINAAN